ncbi:acetolactate decarboxylase [Paraflavisolibacter sp. H34]|uniref:acetolactate decarboxylase n=1 Tax=Huijunlia imazamoxiresistens TaxID=3127457 RepID=UPI0030166965
MRSTFLFAFLLLLTVPSFAQKNGITTFSTIDALLSGIYDGPFSLKEVKKAGNMGIGTVNGLDGELLVYKNKAYAIKSDGVPYALPDSVKVPWATITQFKPGKALPLLPGWNYAACTAHIDSFLTSLNYGYALLVEGTFELVKTRSVPRQQPPYVKMTEIVKTQPVFMLERVEGIMVGFRFPSFVKGVNVPGYHFHFITKDRKAGGHVLDFKIAKAVVLVDQALQLSTILPEGEAFRNLSLEEDREEELKKVEKGQ